MPASRESSSVSPEVALARLVEGNRRFAKANGSALARSWSRKQAMEEQRPFAIILGCSDSRTPVEILFDQGFGELFVVRVAGNIVAPSIVGSIEFAATQFGTRLVVVMGHTHCGAIGATVNALRTGTGPSSKNLQSITNRIAPHIQELVRRKDERILHEAMRANVRASADHLRHGSHILEERVMAGQVVVVGAEYDLETGVVQFFDGTPL